MCSFARILNFFRIFVAKLSLMAEEMDMQHTETEAPKRMVLRAEGLVKKYGKRTVVNGVKFEVRQGEIVGLLGPNGAGKTTSFYMTTGLVVPNGGHVYLDDLEITDFPVYKHAKAGIGYLAQEASVFRKMSVEDNIASVLELTDLTEEEQKEKLEALLDECRLQKVRKNLGTSFQGANADAPRLRDVWPSIRSSSCLTNRLQGSTRLR